MAVRGILPSFSGRSRPIPDLFAKVGKQCLCAMDAITFSTTMQSFNNKRSNKKDVEQEGYERAIVALNTLQSKVDIKTAAVEQNGKTSKKMAETLEHVKRSGLTVDDLRRIPVIHVSGTKGKGSTCALTESILRSHGVKTGFYSSPHLISVTERIRINGEPIEKRRFTEAFWRIWNTLQLSASDDHMPSYFRFLTILGFHIFLDEKVDVIVLEVGIGGELDSTNVVKHTQTVGITSLGLEHTMILGDTLEAIAWQKAGIIKANANVFTTVKDERCLDIIKKRAKDQNAVVSVVPEFASYFRHDERTRSLLSEMNPAVELNASLAIALADDWLCKNRNGFRTNRLLDNDGRPQLSPEIIEGINNFCWPGRFQIINVGNLKFHLDGAHTEDSMHVCSDWFRKVSNNSKKRKALIFNVTRGRDASRLLNILRHKTSFAYACFVPNITSNMANSSDNMDIITPIAVQMHAVECNARVWVAETQDEAKVFPSIIESLSFLRHELHQDEEMDVLVTGSLHLIGGTLLALEEYRQQFRLWPEKSNAII